MVPSEPGLVVIFNARKHAGLVAYMAALHAHCNISDKTIATFVPPLDQDRLLPWWKDRVAEVAQGERVIFLMLRDPKAEEIDGADLMGLAMLYLGPLSSAENGPHRAGVETLLVASKFRAQGGARKLMQALEAEALRRGRTLLLLDTMTDTPNVIVFKKLGFTAAGSVPAFGIGPDGRPQASTFFYKRLGL